jgi:hypothetical protein
LDSLKFGKVKLNAKRRGLRETGGDPGDWVHSARTGAGGECCEDFRIGVVFAPAAYTGPGLPFGDAVPAEKSHCPIEQIFGEIDGIAVRSVSFCIFYSILFYSA